MDNGQTELIWQAFWKRQRSSNIPSILGGERDAVSKAQFQAWSRFVGNLRPEATVLDLATGMGKLPLMLRELQPKLDIKGIDVAEPLPDHGEGIELFGGVSMEATPFPDVSFDAVVSQFGFEYGETKAVSAEILRVIKPEGRIALMVHRGDSPILIQNCKRKEQIEWVHRQALFSRVMSALAENPSDCEAGVAIAQGIAIKGQQKFGSRSLAWEIPEAVRRTLHFALRDTRKKLIETLKLIEQQSENELGCIRSLEKASRTADDRELFLAEIKRSGRKIISQVTIRVGCDEPFAELMVL